MSNISLARLAARRAADGIGPQQSGMCQMWARLTVQALYGDRWDRWLWKPSARAAGAAFTAAAARGELATGASVIGSGDPAHTALGDLLYRTAGDAFGHVMIRVDDNRVAENSSAHHGANGAVGFRPLAAVRFDTIVRLPDPAAVAPPANPRDLLAQIYAAAQGEPNVLKALNRFRRHPAVVDFLD